MTEGEWLTCEDPGPMLTCLTEGPGGVFSCPWKPISDRKLRLFACACVRQVWHLLTDERSRCAVEVTERYADGNAGWSEMEKAYYSTVRCMPHGLVNVTVSDSVLRKTPPSRPNPWDRLFEDCGTSKVQASLLRDIVGNPYRPLATYPRDPQGQFRRVSTPGGEYGATIFPSDWITPTVLSLAQAAYEERDRKCFACNRWTDCKWCKNTRRIPTQDGTLDPVRLAILADALEEADCPTEMECRCELAEVVKPRGPGGQMITRWCKECRNTERKSHPVLAHLRSPGPHVRGCWVLDLILGNE